MVFHVHNVGSIMVYEFTTMNFMNHSTRMMYKSSTRMMYKSSTRMMHKSSTAGMYDVNTATRSSTSCTSSCTSTTGCHCTTAQVLIAATPGLRSSFFTCGSTHKKIRVPGCPVFLIDSNRWNHCYKLMTHHLLIIWCAEWDDCDVGQVPA